jgi:hypothetical protein
MTTLRRLLPAVILLVAALGCSKDETPASSTAPSCTVVAGAISASTFAAAGGTGSVPVTAGSGCAWTATSSAAFVTISAGASGAGNGTISFTVAANAGAARTATLTVAGTAFTISQSAAAVAPPAAGLSAPAAASPTGGQLVATTRPTLVVNNAAATGNVGAVTYRFEVSDQPGFPNDTARTVVIDGVAQGGSTTTAVVTRDLGTDTVHYWHARATDGTVTSAYSATETFKTPANVCAFTVSPATVSVSNNGGAVAITVTTGATCAWTAASNASFITLSPASGTGTGTVTATVATGSGPERSGTLTIGGQTVTITQTAAGGIAAGFRMFDPAISQNPTTECRITSPFASICTLESTSFPLGTNGLVSFAWTVQWTDGSLITRTQSGAGTTFSFTHTCGGPNSTTDGAPQPLSVTLSVTDSFSNTTTVTSGSGSQPPLFIRLFTC